MGKVTPCSWIQIRVGEAGICITGNTPSTKDPSNYGGNVPYIKPPQLNNQIVSVGDETLSDKGAQLARILPKNSILVSCIGNLGRAALNTVPAAFNQQINAIIPSGEIFPKFLFYQVQSSEFRKQLEEISTATTISIVNKRNFEKIKINLAPFDEQKRIVAKIEELFSELDNGIAALKTAREKLKLYRQAVLKHAFEGKLTAQWREENKDKLETPEQLLARIQKEREARYQQQLEEWKAAVKVWEENGKEGKKPSKPRLSKQDLLLSQSECSDLPDLPDGYVYTYLANLGDLGRGKSKHRPRNDPRLFDGKYPFIQTGDVKAANRQICTYTQTYSEFGLRQSKLWPKGTLCITIAANIAETAFLGFDGCFPDSVVGFSSYGSVLPEYVELFIKAVRVHIEAYAPSTAQKNINLKTLENLVIPYCSIYEQVKIVDRLNYIFSITEPASELLARIQAERELNRKKNSKRARTGK